MGSENTKKTRAELDLGILSGDFLGEAKRRFWLGILLVLLLSAVTFWQACLSYSPQYQATASFTVYVTDPLGGEVSDYNSAISEQLSKTFPKILTSGALSDVVRQDLGISEMPSVSVSALENTNLFTLTVTAEDPKLAYDVLSGLIACYPSVAESVVGPTTLRLLDDSGVPAEPVNSRYDPSALKKGVFTGLALWLGIVLLFTLARSTIHNETELLELADLHSLGSLPYVKGLRNLPSPLLTAECGIFGASVRLLCVRAEKALRERGGKVLLVSGSIPGEGNTAVAVNLAIALAQTGKRTLLVDCDLRCPSVSAVFGKDEARGLSGYLKGEEALEEVIQPLEIENLFATFAGKPAANAPELLSKKETGRLIDTARGRFDYVILDTPPCALLADASEAAELADATLLTVRQNYASKDQIREAVQTLSDSGLPLIGCVMNGVKQK